MSLLYLSLMCILHNGYDCSSVMSCLRVLERGTRSEPRSVSCSRASQYWDRESHTVMSQFAHEMSENDSGRRWKSSCRFCSVTTHPNSEHVFLVEKADIPHEHLDNLPRGQTNGHPFLPGQD